MVKITVTSDLHGHFPKTSGGDILIIAGDLTAKDDSMGYLMFFNWLHCQKYKHFIIVAGNHDGMIEKDFLPMRSLANTYYLEDSGVELCGLKFWGSPWSLWFHGINPKCKAFTGSESLLSGKFSKIPENTDILITHSPPKYLRDQINHGPYPENVGSKSLQMICRKMKYHAHFFGHIHEGYGYELLNRDLGGSELHVANCSHVNERYQPINPPIDLEI